MLNNNLHEVKLNIDTNYTLPQNIGFKKQFKVLCCN